MSSLGNLERMEADLWQAADQLRANSNLTSSEYCMPVLGIIFLRHATNRYKLAQNPLRMDYYRRYQEIVAEHNRERPDDA